MSKSLLIVGSFLAERGLESEPSPSRGEGWEGVEAPCFRRPFEDAGVFRAPPDAACLHPIPRPFPLEGKGSGARDQRRARRGGGREVSDLGRAAGGGVRGGVAGMAGEG